MTERYLDRAQRADHATAGAMSTIILTYFDVKMHDHICVFLGLFYLGYGDAVSLYDVPSDCDIISPMPCNCEWANLSGDIPSPGIASGVGLA